jgi:hypothetical protein
MKKWTIFWNVLITLGFGGFFCGNICFCQDFRENIYCHESFLENLYITRAMRVAA